METKFVFKTRFVPSNSESYRISEGRAPKLLEMAKHDADRPKRRSKERPLLGAAIIQILLVCISPHPRCFLCFVWDTFLFVQNWIPLPCRFQANWCLLSKKTAYMACPEQQCWLLNFVFSWIRLSRCDEPVSEQNEHARRAGQDTVVIHHPLLHFVSSFAGMWNVVRGIACKAKICGSKTRKLKQCNFLVVRTGMLAHGRVDYPGSHFVVQHVRFLNAERIAVAVQRCPAAHWSGIWTKWMQPILQTRETLTTVSLCMGVLGISYFVHAVCLFSASLSKQRRKKLTTQTWCGWETVCMYMMARSLLFFFEYFTWNVCISFRVVRASMRSLCVDGCARRHIHHVFSSTRTCAPYRRTKTRVHGYVCMYLCMYACMHVTRSDMNGFYTYTHIHTYIRTDT